MKKIILAALIASSPLSAKEVEDVVILGGGVGALTSALYLSRGSLHPIVIEGNNPGGAIAQSLNVQNWPGEMEIAGSELTEKIHRQAEASGAIFANEEVISVDFTSRPFTITTRSILDPSQTRQIKTQSAIIALGATPKALGVPGETTYWTKGVYTCAVCDGGLYRDQVVAVVGGGDAAILEAHHLAKIAKKVYIINRKTTFRGTEEIRKKEVLSESNIEVMYDTVVKEIKGNEEGVTHLALSSFAGTPKGEIPVDALFLAIGSTPNTQLFEKQIELDKAGYIVLKKDQETSVKGVFAVGDIADPIYKQAISAAGDGAIAALQSEAYLASAHQVKETPSTLLTRSRKKILEPIVAEIKSLGQMRQELESADGPILIDFYATWCPPCKRLAPIFDGWATQYAGSIKFLKVNVDENRELIRMYQITSMPTLLLLDKKGKTIEKHVGIPNVSQFKTILDNAAASG